MKLKEYLNTLETIIEKHREIKEKLAAKQEERKRYLLLLSTKRIPPGQEWKLKKLKDATEEGDKKLKIYQEFFDKLQRGTQEQPRESQTSQDTLGKTRKAADNPQRKRTNEVVAASDADAGVEFVEKVTPKKTKVFEAMEVEVLKKEQHEEEQVEHLMCKFCHSAPERKERLYTTAAALKAHVEGEHEGSLGKELSRQCPVCPYSATRPSRVMEHIRAMHSKEELFQCGCGEKFKTYSAYSAHQKRHGHGN